ncbi:MAG: Rrf2 family transcriptional regulator [Gammaproteobacteria bacterium]|jgi:FeS assembly SUF system regulator|nr:SUF system Fe-S cluster assembly regulator [Chromatiales bacterium]MDP6674640.1 Rrf2 family transcriptional regulator [Gammaproteobacteria bacterium]
MLRLGRLPDYGLVIATVFVDAEGLLTTRDVVQRSKIPIATVRKLLKYMVDAGLLNSFRGNKGGYKLACPASEISVADIIQAIDGPISLTDCTGIHPDNRCSLEATCPLAHKWCEVNKEIVEKLQSVSIKEITA